MRKRNLTAFLKVPGEDTPHVEKPLTVTLSAELSTMLKAEMERTGMTAEEIAEHALRLQFRLAS